MQSGEWGELKSSFGWRVSRVVNDSSGAQILFRSLPFGFSIGYIPKGPIGKLDDPLLWQEIDQVCQENHAIFLKVELDGWLNDPLEVLPTNLGFSQSRYNIQPPRTIIIDLEKPENDILLSMRQKTRYNIHLAEKKGVVVRSWADIPSFHKMLSSTGRRDDFNIHSLAYYQRAYDLFSSNGSCELLVAQYESMPLAALMVFSKGKRAWYLYGASTDLERSRMPAYLLQWEAMQWAKKQGCLEYDLWGIPDEPEETLEEKFTDKKTGLWGVYRFKRGFGGDVKRASQALDKVYKPWLYQLYLFRMAGRESG